MSMVQDQSSASNPPGAAFLASITSRRVVPPAGPPAVGGEQPSVSPAPPPPPRPNTKLNGASTSKSHCWTEYTIQSFQFCDHYSAVYEEPDGEVYVKDVEAIAVTQITDIQTKNSIEVERRQCVALCGVALWDGELVVCNECDNFLGLIRRGENPKSLASVRLRGVK